MPGDLISAIEAAKRLKVSRAQASRLCKNGTLKHQRIGNVLKIDPDSVAAAAARRTVGRPKKWKFEPLVAELRNRGYDSLAARIEKIFGIE
jgi:hypothetical protein